MRNVDVVYVTIKLLTAAAGPRALLNYNAKWQDWSLVGGHVEPGEARDSAAAREAEEEMNPLTYGADFALEPLGTRIPSRFKSAVSGDYYWTRFYALKFRTDPVNALGRLERGAFRLFSQDELAGPGVGAPVAWLRDSGLGTPLAWNSPLSLASLEAALK
jgi:8-oxo-dGTP pyrophosphatase MutT (NUDIX family)